MIVTEYMISANTLIIVTEYMSVVTTLITVTGCMRRVLTDLRHIAVSMAVHESCQLDHATVPAVIG